MASQAFEHTHALASIRRKHTLDDGQVSYKQYPSDNTLNIGVQKHVISNPYLDGCWEAHKRWFRREALVILSDGA